MTWIVKELQLSLLLSALLHSRRLHARKRKKILSASRRKWKVKNTAFTHTKPFTLWFLFNFTSSSIEWRMFLVSSMTCAILWSCLVRSTVSPPQLLHFCYIFTFLIQIISFLFFPFPVFILLGIFPPWLSPVCLSTWDWHYQLISRSAPRTA